MARGTSEVDARMRATLILSDHAQVAEGKLFISGAGWNEVTSPTSPMSVAVVIAVPWNDANRKIDVSLVLNTEDGGIAVQPGPIGGTDSPVQVNGAIEVGRPVGATPGSDLDVPLAFNIPPMNLEPGRYVWRLSIDGESQPDWRLPFTVRRR